MPWAFECNGIFVYPDPGRVKTEGATGFSLGW